MIDLQDELLLSELIDGRPVDPDRLAQVLESPTGRASLVEFSRLRSGVTADLAEPSEGFAERVEAGLARATKRVGRPSVLLAAASLLLGVVLTLALQPRQAATVAPSIDAPPEANRVLRFEVGEDWTEAGS